MRAFLSPYLSRRALTWAAAGSLMLLFAGSYTDNYDPIRQSLHRHYLEAHGAAPWQEAEASQTKLAEQVYADDLVQYRLIAASHYASVTQMLRNTSAAIQATASVANRPTFYQSSGLSPEETSTHDACNDPAGVSDLLDRTARRDRNIFACAVYLSMNAEDSRPTERNVTMALLQRVAYANQEGYYPFPVIVAYIWLSSLADKIEQTADVPPMPELTKGEDMNPAIFDGRISPGFALRLIQTATIDEKLSLRSNIWPDLCWLHDLAAQIVTSCRTLHKSPCVPEQ